MIVYYLLFFVLFLIYIFQIAKPTVMNHPLIEPMVFDSEIMKKNVYSKHNITLDGKNKTLTQNNKTIHYDNNFNNLDAIKIANDKRLTNQVLSQHHLPVCNFYIYDNKLSIDENIQKMNKSVNFPIVVKYALGEKGNFVYTDIQNNEQAVKKIKYLLDNKKAILVEEQAVGDKFRIFVLNDEIVYISRDNPPIIKGDGKSTVLQLIKKYTIPIKNYDEDLIKTQGYTLESILPDGKSLKVTNVINFSNGANLEIIPIDSVHPDNIALFKNINKIMNLKMNGIDFITPSLNIPNVGKIIEVNPFPGFAKVNLLPSVVDRFVKALFV